jgi:uncharacterized protein
LHLLDANILIYAFRRDSPYHGPCYRWLTAALAAGMQVATTAIVEVALLRITTLPTLGAAAAAPRDVFRFLAALKGQPASVGIEPGDNHLPLFAKLCEDLKLRGNDVNDAYLAALALEHGATLVSADRGFRRFPELQVLNPLAEGSQ